MKNNYASIFCFWSYDEISLLPYVDLAKIAHNTPQHKIWIFHGQNLSVEPYPVHILGTLNFSLCLLSIFPGFQDEYQFAYLPLSINYLK